jgi:hypothetical protein
MASNPIADHFTRSELIGDGAPNSPAASPAPIAGISVCSRIKQKYF